MFKISIDSSDFNSDKLLLEATITAIIAKVAEAAPYKHLITTRKIGFKREVDFSRLPNDVIEKIRRAFVG